MKMFLNYFYISVINSDNHVNRCETFSIVVKGVPTFPYLSMGISGIWRSSHICRCWYKKEIGLNAHPIPTWCILSPLNWKLSITQQMSSESVL